MDACGHRDGLHRVAGMDAFPLHLLHGTDGDDLRRLLHHVDGRDACLLRLLHDTDGDDRLNLPHRVDGTGACPHHLPHGTDGDGPQNPLHCVDGKDACPHHRLHGTDGDGRRSLLHRVDGKGGPDLCRSLRRDGCRGLRMNVKDAHHRESVKVRRCAVDLPVGRGLCWKRKTFLYPLRVF